MGSKSAEDMGARPRIEQGGNDKGRKSGQLDLSNGSANGQVCDLVQKFLGVMLFGCQIRVLALIFRFSKSLNDLGDQLLYR